MTAISRSAGSIHFVPTWKLDRLVDPRELMLLAALLGIYGLWTAGLVPGALWLVNFAGPGTLAIILSTGAWWQVRRDARSVWQPLFWFRIACAAYYGVGALIPYIANDVTVQFIRIWYDFSEEDMLKIGVINVLSTLIVLATASIITGRKYVSRIPNRLRSSNLSHIFLFATLLLIGGGAMRYLIVLPWTLGVTDYMPGIVVPLARAYNIGLFLLVLAAMRGSRIAAMLAVILVPIDLVVGLLTFAKNHVLLTLMFVCLGVLHDRLSLPRALMAFVVVFGVYSQLDPIIHYGREELQRLNRENKGPLHQRIEILARYTGTERQGTHKEELQNWLLRLSYVNVESLVVNWYDVGQSGESLKDALIVLVPRIFWPDKPEVSLVGADLYTATTGQEGTSISPGLFGEAYWNFGWFGIPLLMVPLGGILAVFSHYSLRVMRQEQLLQFPGVLLGVIIGYRVDGWFVIDIIGASGIALSYIIIASALERFIARRSPRS